MSAHGLAAMLAAAALGAGLAAAAPAKVSVTLAREGQPAATLVIARDATRAAQFAAYELQWHLRQITGGEFAIARDDESTTGARILVGDSVATRALDIKAESLKSQEYLIRFEPDTIVLLGRDKDDRGIVQYNPTPSAEELATWPGIWDEQGTMYAAYEFLERYCNVRWFNPTETGTDCPRQPSLAVTGSGLQRSPFTRYRYAAYPSSESYDAYTGLWPGGSEGYERWEAAAYPELHRRFPGGEYTIAKRGWVTLFRLRHREGGEICLGNHSLYGYYRRFWESEAGQESLFEAKHPDWFAQGYEGKPPQMCYTSRGLVEQVAKDACEFFETGKTYPGAQAAGDCFCVEPMDNDAFCKCAACRKWLTGRDADSPFFSNGRHSDYFFQFVNEVAKIVGAKHPDKRIVCLAYMTHAAPPEKLKLEPNVIVQYCFACNRLNFDRPSYEHEEELLKQWRATNPGRTLYLWLYYTFPVEVANNGQFHCFPGFFARAIGEQFRLFHAQEFRGVFHCGYGQDVEAYVTYRLMDEPLLDVDKLLDEYFQRLYGAAAGPMQKLYETIEETYGNPANYPEPIASGRIEGHHHQTEEVAWGYLGTERRIAELSALMQQAKDAAQTPEQRARVELFALGTWDYMVAGHAQYLEHAKARYGGQGAPLRVPFASSGPLGGDPRKLDAGEALALITWRSRIAEPTRRKCAARLLNDGEWLYVQLEEQIGQAGLQSSADPAAGDRWEMYVASGRQAPLRKLLMAPTGQSVATEGDTPWDCGARVESVRSTRGVWITSCALPLARLSPSRPDGRAHLFLNIARRSPQGDEPVWSPTFGSFDDPSALRELILDGPETITENLPTADELRRLDTQGLVARWRLDEGQGLTVKSSAAGDLPGTLTNKPQWVKDGGRSVVRLEDSRRQYIDFGSPPAVNLTGPLTMLLWVKYESSEVWYPGLLGKGYEATGTYGLHLRPGLTPWFELDSPDGTRNIYNPTDLCLTPGQWNQVAATYDGQTMRVYLNGREAGTGKEVQTTIRTNEEPLRFGWLGSYGNFNGCVRDISLYSRALSAAEVFAQYKAGR
jgi:predicted secreted protein